MSWIPLRERINTLPLILAGPILRSTRPNAVTVWVALKESCNVTLEIFDTRGNLLITGSRTTIKLGTNLHVVAVTAASVSNVLLAGENYLYNLDFGNGKKLNYPGILNNEGSISAIAYPPYYLPSFALPPENINELRILHGSCRKLHGENLDALAALDKMIREALAQEPKKRPHQLFLTGDQIYVDDVADSLLLMLMDASDTLLGWSEPLPDVKNTEELLPGKRNRLATNIAGLTASLNKLNRISNLAKSHLLAFGEFLTMYLFAWSDILWVSPEDFPQFSDINPTAPLRKATAEFEKEVNYLKECLSTLKEVRRGLANIPTYMIFDDHEITDDWNLNMTWCDRVLSKPLGRRTIQNGLVAYAICQAWGNTPNQFTKDNPGAMLLVAVENWSASGGKDEKSEREITLRIGLPSVAEIKNTNPRLLPNYDTAIDWHYIVTGSSYEVIILDTRTCRGFPGRNFDFPALLSEEACHKQISKPDNSDIKVTFVISPSPLIGLPFLEGIQKYATTLAEKLGTPAWGFDPEAWGLEPKAFEQFLARLALRTLPQSKSRVILLSGDVHYSFSARLQYSATKPFESETINSQMVIAQFTSSSFKNEKREPGGSYSLHVKGFIPFRLIDHHPKAEILGWTNLSKKDLEIGTFYTYSEYLMPFYTWRIKTNPAIVDLVENRSWFRLFEITKKPEWYYRIDFLAAQLEDVNIPLSLDSQNPISIVAPLPGQDREKPLKAYLTMAKNHCDRMGFRNTPKQVVGVNNLGEITLEFTNDKHVAVQTLWWRLESYNNTFLEPFPLTRYEVSLDFDDPEYSMDDVLKEVI